MVSLLSQVFKYNFKTILLGTSNWAKDYYTRTAGIGFAFESVGSQTSAGKSDLRTELLDVFIRDWNSPHCKNFK